MQGSLFDFDTPKKDEVSDKTALIKPVEQIMVTDVESEVEIQKNNSDTSVKNIESASRMVKRVVVFYTDNTFEEFISTP